MQVLTWKAWTEYVLQRRAKHEQAHVARLHWGARRLRHILSCWRERLHAAKQRRPAAAALRARIMRRGEASLQLSFGHSPHPARTPHFLLLEHHLSSCKTSRMSLQAMAWATWRERVQLQKVKRAALLPLTQRLRQRKRQRLFTAWHAACKRLVAQRGTLDACAARLRTLLLARTLSAWKGWAAQKQHHR